MNTTEQIRGWWQSLTGRSQTNARPSGSSYRRPESLCPECGSENITEDFNRETSTQVSYCPDCGYQRRHEVLFQTDPQVRRLHRSPG